MATYLERYFEGTPQTVINLATDIAAGNFSGAPAATYDNTSDSTYPNAANANAMLEMPDWASAPAAGTKIELWGVLKDTDGTDDDTDAPSGTASGGARQFGAWTVAGVDALQRRTILIDTAGCNKIDFYLKNMTAVLMNNDGGTNCVVKVTPVAFGFVG